MNTQRKTFAKEFLVDFNGTQAAIRAGYAKKSAHVAASRLLRNDKVIAYIKKIQDERREKYEVDSKYVLRRHIEIDNMDVKDILDANNNLLPIDEWPTVWRRSLDGFDLDEVVQGETESGEQRVKTVLSKIKFPNKLQNLKLLGEHIDIGAYDARFRVEGNLQANIKIVPKDTAGMFADSEDQIKRVE